MQKIIIICAMLLFCCLSCKKTEEASTEKASGILFDKTKWNTKEGENYPYRDKMIDNLISSDTIKKLNKDSILNLLGEPERIDNNHLFYIVAQERLQSWPLHTKTMVIKLKDDGTVDWVKTHE
jgi:hypothetical protein